MNKTLVNQLAQLFVFGVRAIVSSNSESSTGYTLGKPRDHLALLQKQLDAVMEANVLPGHVIEPDEVKPWCVGGQNL